MTTGYTASQVIKMLHLDISHSAILKAEEAGRIPTATRNKQSSYRYWSKNDLPEIAKVFGNIQRPLECAVIAVYMSKGGIGKTTFTYNFGELLAIHGHRVLIIGTDFQCSVSKYFGISKTSQPHSLFDVISNDKIKSLREIIIKSDLPNLSLVPENRDLNFLDVVIMSKLNRENLLSKYIEEIKKDYDAILIDCPPYWSQVVTNAIMAADYIVAPLTADDDSYQSLEHFLSLLTRFKKDMNKEWRGLKFIANMVDNQTNIEKDYHDLLIEKYGKFFTKRYIRRAAAIKEASALKQSIFEYKPRSLVADDYYNCILEAWNDILRRQKLYVEPNAKENNHTIEA